MPRRHPKSEPAETLFTRDELNVIQKNVRRRYRKDRNIVGVGFGTAFLKGRRDSRRSFVMTFFVRKKWKRVRQARRVPDKIVFRLKRDGCYRTFHLPTDVIELPPLIKTGAEMLPSGGSKPLGTVGAVVSWRGPASSNWEWGLLAVGHFFPKVGTWVRVVSARPLLIGKVVYRSRATDPVDAGVVTVDGDDLVLSGLVPSLGEDPAPYWDRKQLIFEIQQTRNLPGMTLPPGKAKPFVVDHYLAELPPEWDLGRLSDAIIVRAVGHKKIFSKGTSGSSWHVVDIQGALQVGADKETFSIGVGQMLDTALQWSVLKKALGARELRFYAFF